MYLNLLDINNLTVVLYSVFYLNYNYGFYAQFCGVSNYLNTTECKAMFIVIISSFLSQFSRKCSSERTEVVIIKRLINPIFKKKLGMCPSDTDGAPLACHIKLLRN